jgi:hypothetical protein
LPVLNESSVDWIILMVFLLALAMSPLRSLMVRRRKHLPSCDGCKKIIDSNLGFNKWVVQKAKPTEL